MIKALCGARIFDGEQFFDQYALLVANDKIVGLMPETQLSGQFQRLELQGGVLAPGFIDVQVNGGGGLMFNDHTDVESLKTMVAGHRKFGTVGMLPTLISDTAEVSRAGAIACEQAIQAGVKEVLGVHIEGPFFNPVRRGVHQEQYLRVPDEHDLEWPSLCPSGTVLMTLAPEMVGLEKVSQLLLAGGKIACGHTAASYEQTRAALDLGVDGFTHLFNAMSQMEGRNPGVVGAALEDPESWIGIIVDGHHVHKASLKVALAAKKKGKMMLVTDAMSTIGTDDTSFVLYGEQITVKDGALISAEGKLAGSAISMIDAVRNTNQWLGLPLDEALRMASLYPAEYLGLANRLGRLRPGFDASFVHFDSNFRVTQTWVAGQDYHY